MFSVAELEMLLEALQKVYGPGYSSMPNVAKLQAKLSILLEAARNMLPGGGPSGVAP